VTVRSVSDQVIVDHCPICAVTCQCAKCVRRLHALAIDLKKRSEAQGGAEAGNTDFDDMFTCWTKAKAGEMLYKELSSGNKQRESISSKASEEELKAKSTPKVEKPKSKQLQTKGKRKSIARNSDVGPVHIRTGKAKPLDFPREVRGGRDVDPGTAIDYLTVYTDEGRYIMEPDLSHIIAPKTASNNPDVVAEDGNVDYCHKCRKHGNLICCDFCPRAFHEKCLEGSGNEDDSKWECHVCLREKEDLPAYTLMGMDSQPLIGAAYNGLRATTDDDLRQISVLSKMHEMIEKLTNGDFGALFAVPVDCRVVTDYLKFIKRPMDLGTIGAKLLNGTYKSYFEANQSWDDIHTAVLTDLELVFHNW
jgi:Bromodomain